MKTVKGNISAIASGKLCDCLTLVSTIIQSLQDTAQEEEWQYLITRPHPWRRQLYIKGRKLLALTIWQDALANEMSPEQAAENWDLLLAAIYEVIRYCENHRGLLKLEADEESDRLEYRMSRESNTPCHQQQSPQ